MKYLAIMRHTIASVASRIRLFRGFRERNYDLRTSLNLAKHRQREMSRGIK